MKSALRWREGHRKRETERERITMTNLCTVRSKHEAEIRHTPHTFLGLAGK